MGSCAAGVGMEGASKHRQADARCFRTHQTKWAVRHAQHLMEEPISCAQRERPPDLEGSFLSITVVSLVE